MIMILYKRWQYHIKFMKVRSQILYNVESSKLFVNIKASLQSQDNNMDVLEKL